MKLYILLSMTFLFVSCTNRTPNELHSDCLINDEQLFVNIAENILFHEYGRKNIIQQKPYTVNFINDSIWSLRGNSNNTFGGEFYIEINCKDARVLKIKHTK